MTTALLVIDVQTALCTGEWAAFDIDRVVERINGVARRARAANAPVILVQHEDDGPLRHGTDGWSLYAPLAVDGGDLRVRKTASDAFHGTELQQRLGERGVTGLIVCGLQSDFCVDTTVRKALSLGYPVQLVADGHSTCDNGLLTAAQIIAHHTLTLTHLDSFGPRVTAPLADAVRIDA
jgi:nicotinamidase-related amidase